jgi:hypothetical protein
MITQGRQYWTIVLAHGVESEKLAHHYGANAPDRNGMFAEFPGENP